MAGEPAPGGHTRGGAEDAFRGDTKGSRSCKGRKHCRTKGRR